MTLLTPLGLLGLIGILILIIIYIIKPNYQQKYISSTYIWKLSLKYRKKKIPVSKLRNILLIICQVLILTAGALILAKPAEVLKNQVEVREVIAIIDSSASMRTTFKDETRFKRAVNGVLTLSDEVWSENGIVSVILAENKAGYLTQRAEASYQTKLKKELGDMLKGDDIACTYGTSDVDGAMQLCEEVLFENPYAEIYLYTDKDYDYVPENITVKNVAVEEEWNAAILNAYSEYSDGYHAFYVEVACYGSRARDVDVRLEVQNVNADSWLDKGVKKVFTKTVSCEAGRKKTVIFMNKLLVQGAVSGEDTVYFEIPHDNVKDDSIHTYQTAFVSISTEEQDNFSLDNTFQIYGGQKEDINVLYASTNPNPFYGVGLETLSKVYRDQWNIIIDEMKKPMPGEKETIPNQGYDFYFYEESRLPTKLPTDGVVVLIDPDPEKLPKGTGITFGGEQVHPKGKTLTSDEMSEAHPVMKNMNAENIEVTVFKEMNLSGFDTLMYCNSKPVVAVRNEKDSKMAVVGFSVHYSTFAIKKEFPLFLYNLIGYFMPSTLEKTNFEVNETVNLNARGDELKVNREGVGAIDGSPIKEFPASIQVALPGTYSFEQTIYSGATIKEYIYVHIPVAESNISERGDALLEPERTHDDIEYFKDLMFYFAAAMVALLFAEWWLQSRENS